jgi:hypothetical protein
LEAASFNAFGDAVAYVAYVDGQDVDVYIFNEANNSWNLADYVAVDAESVDSIAASGTHAYVSCSTYNGQAGYIRTTNDGASWSGTLSFPSPTAFGRFAPQLFLSNGVLRAAYAACENAKCTREVSFFAKSSDGYSWSTPQQVSGAEAPQTIPYGITMATNVIVAYTAWAPTADVWTAVLQ